MVSIDAYLDRVCGKLRVNPAEAEDIREELLLIRTACLADGSVLK